MDLHESHDAHDPHEEHNSHLPPPPYSETDLYSASSGPRSPGETATSPHTVDAVATTQPISDAASSVDQAESIPHYTPTSSVFLSQHDDVDHGSATSAAAYFESRPAPAMAWTSVLVRTLMITAITSHNDLPYDPEWQMRGVTPTDWTTFLNFLIPDYISRVNNNVAEQKLQAEQVDERLEHLTLGSVGSRRTDTSQAEAQLSPLRKQEFSNEASFLANVAAVVTEWNEGFFGPRGIEVRYLEPEPQENSPSISMPGTWNSYGQEDAAGPSSAAGQTPTTSFPPFLNSALFPSAGDTTRSFRMGPIIADRNGFRIGSGLVADKNGFRLGQGLVADKNGFRLGQALVADKNGFRLGQSFVADSNGVRVGGPRGIVADRNGLSIWGRGFGRQDRVPSDAKEGISPQPEQDDFERGRSCGQNGGRHSRDLSVSSSSSTSSSSSASVGSLPDYDHMKGSQLAVARQSLLDWLDHPDQPVTREAVQQLRRDLKDAKKNGQPITTSQDVTALRREVKDLMKQFKQLKKTQRATRKEMRRMRRDVRKAARKERHAARKETKKLRKEAKKAAKGKGRADVVPTPTSATPVGQESLPSQRGPGWRPPLASDAQRLHAQAAEVEAKAVALEAEVAQMRADQGNEKSWLRLEEQAEEYRREAQRLRAEATQMEVDLSKVLVAKHHAGQETGVVQRE